jgi:type II secretory pathway predicted ATPase ExeA/S1-C subfamily serine protease
LTVYATYFGLREKPFNATPDARFFYTNPSYREAYATLLYGIRERKGFIALTGEVGTGKTTLLRRLMDNMDPTIKVVFLYNTTLEFDELVEFICGELKIVVNGLSRVGRLQALENLRLISNLETATAKLLQIVLVGQPELEWKLADPALRQVTQRITVRHRLQRLSDAEVEPFIDHRLRVMGRQRQDLFTDDAIRKLIPYVNGIPRLINVVCDNALLVAYGMDATRVTGAIIDEVIADLRLRAPGPPPTKSPTPRHTERLERQYAPESGWAVPPAAEPRSRWISISSAVVVGIGIAAIVSWGAPGLASLADWTLAWGRKLACSTDTNAPRGPQESDARRTQSAPTSGDRAVTTPAPPPPARSPAAASNLVPSGPIAAAGPTVSAPASEATRSPRAQPAPPVREQMRRQRDGERLAEGRTVASAAPAAERRSGASNSPSSPSESATRPVESATRAAKAATPALPAAAPSGSPRWEGAPIAPLLQAVVDVRRSRRPSLREESDAQTSTNRGFIVDGQGYIVTSDKISGAPSIEVTLHDGRVLGATVVARDRSNAVAILKVERRGLPALTLGDSGALAVGERVLVIGDGDGLEGASTAGTVVATSAGAGGHLTVDLPPKPETVGGPLLNHRGQAVGIVTDNGATAGGQRAVTFAVPVDRVKSLLGNLKRGPAPEPDRRERTAP